MYNEEKNFDFNMTPTNFKQNQISLKEKRPFVSIITAYYNVGEYFEDAVKSILNQTFPFWEWIIVNDGSTEPGTIELLEDYAKKDNRIKVYHKQNEGLPKTRDYAIERAGAEYLYIFDPDDLVDPTFLECGYWSLKTNPSASWVYSNHVAFQNMEYTCSTSFDIYREKKENVICGSSMIRKQCVLEVGGYSKAPRGVYEDWHLWLRILAKGHYPIKMNYYGFWYRRREGVLHSINKNKQNKKNAMSVINTLVKKITNYKITAIQFPVKTNIKEFLYPNTFNWSEKPLKFKTNKKQVLFILPWFTVGGADSFNLELISKLDKSKYDITIVTTEYSKYVTRQKFEPHATIFDLTTFLKQKDWAGFIHYLIKSRKIDLVFLSNSFYGYYVTPWLKSEFPNVSFVDYLHAEDFSWRNGGYPRDSIAISNVLDMTYTCTEHLKDVMYKKMGRVIKNTKTIYIGVDSDKYSPFNTDIKALDMSKYNDKKIVLFACRIYELKRPIFVLKVLQKLLEVRNDIVLFVVGDGPQLNEMKKIATECKLDDNIVFFGMKPDLRPYYNVADVTLITSLTEGLTFTAYESLSMGVPVISSDVGGQSELVGDDCGKIIKPYQSVEKDLFNRNYSEVEIKEYADAAISIIDNKKKDILKDNCRKKILASFTINNSVQNLSLEFEKLILQKNEKPIVDKEIAKNYLSLYLQANPLCFDKQNIKWGYKTKIKEKLWSIPAWRFLVKTAKKTKIIEMKKKIFKK